MSIADTELVMLDPSNNERNSSVGVYPIPDMWDVISCTESPAVWLMPDKSSPKFSDSESMMDCIASSKSPCKSESMFLVSEMYLPYWVSCKFFSASSSDTFIPCTFALVSSDMSPA